MQKNIGTADQYLRLVSGTIALVSAVQTRRNPLVQAALTTYGAMKVAEGITGWCPLMHALGIQSTEDTQAHKKGTQPSAKRAPLREPVKNLAKPSDNDGSHANGALETTYTSSETDSLNTSYQ
jgi:hypothetical protein